MVSERLKQTKKWLRRGLNAARFLVIGYCLFLLVGMIPINRGFKPTPDGVAVFVRSSAVHADLVLPVDHSACNWREVFSPSDMPAATDWATHVAIGWGDRGFYLDTPTWNDLRASTALNALLLPSGSVLHVDYTRSLEADPKARRILLSNEQYADLCESIQRSLLNGRATAIEGEHYGSFDAFYEARGSYHCFYTCNSWVGRRLAAAGVATPLWTPLPGSPCWYLDEPTKSPTH